MSESAPIDVDAMLAGVLPLLLDAMRTRGGDPAADVFGLVIAQPGTMLHASSRMAPREMYCGWSDPAGLRKLFNAADPAEASALRALEARWKGDDTPVVIYTAGADGTDVMTLAALSRAEIADLLAAAAPPPH